jgi:hypothetical protein
MLLEHLFENGRQSGAYQSLGGFGRVRQILQLAGQLEFENPSNDTVLKVPRKVDKLQGVLILFRK